MLESLGNKQSSFLPPSPIWNISPFMFSWDVFFKSGMFMFLADVCAGQSCDDNRKSCKHHESILTTKAMSMHTIHACKHTHSHTLSLPPSRCGVLSLCGPALGCGVKQEMCEPWRHVFMLAAAAHHQPEGKQTPAPLHLLSLSISLLLPSTWSFLTSALPRFL